MLDAAGTRGGLPVLLPGGVDFPAASARGWFRGFLRRRSDRRRGRPAASRSLSELSQKTGRPVTNSSDLFLERRHIHPPVGLRLYGADPSTQLLGQRDYALLDRVGWSC